MIEDVVFEEVTGFEARLPYKSTLGVCSIRHRPTGDRPEAWALNFGFNMLYFVFVFVTKIRSTIHGKTHMTYAKPL